MRAWCESSSVSVPANIGRALLTMFSCQSLHCSIITLLSHFITIDVRTACINNEEYAYSWGIKLLSFMLSRWMSREWLMDRCSVWSAVTRVRPKHVTMSRHITPHHHNARLRSNDININMTATEMSCSLTQMTSQCWRLCDDSWSLWPVLTRSGWLPIYHLSAEASNDGPSWRYLLIRHLYQFHLMIFSVAWHCILQTQWE